MQHIGKYLARARTRLDEIRLENEEEYIRRHRNLYSRLPELKEMDIELTRQMNELFKISLGGSANTDLELQQLKSRNLDLQMKRAETLKAQGYPIDYLDSVYTCKLCHDTGLSGNGICSCLEELYRRECIEGLLSCLPERNCSFDTFDISLYDSEDSRRAMKAIFAGCRKFAENFPNVSNGFLFQGGSGLGKTFLASSIARSVTEKGYNVIYSSSVPLFSDYETERFSRSPEETEAAENRILEYLNCDLLIIDDLGSELSSAVSVSSLYSLLSSRILKNRKTVICTCCPDDELKRRYGEQTFSRIKGELVPFAFSGHDIRLKKRGL